MREDNKRPACLFPAVSASKEMASINIIVDDAVNSLGQQLNTKGIRIEKRLYDDLPYIPLDPLQISQVLNNILLNAVQSIPVRKGLSKGLINQAA